MFWQQETKGEKSIDKHAFDFVQVREGDFFLGALNSSCIWTLVETKSANSCLVCDQMVTHKKSTLIVACSVNIWTVVPKFFFQPTGHLNNYLLTTSSIFSSFFFWICTKDLFYQKSLFFSEDFSHGSPKSNERLARETFLKSTHTFSLTIYWLHLGS